MESILKATEESNPDSQFIPTALELLRHHLTKMNEITGHYENRYKINELMEKFTWRGEKQKLMLEDEQRLLVQSGKLERVNSEGLELEIFLFDNVIVFAKKSKKPNDTSLIVYKEPFPLYLVKVTEEQEVETTVGLPSPSKEKTMFFTLKKKDTSNTIASQKSIKSIAPKTDSTFTFVICNVGRSSRQYMFKAASAKDKEQWMERIQTSAANFQATMKVANQISKAVNLPNARVNSAVFCENVLFLATESGLYSLTSGSNKYNLIVNIEKFTQVDYSEEHKTLVAIAGKEQELFTFPLEILLRTNAPLDIGLKVPNSSGSSLFKIGTCLGKEFVGYIRNKADSVFRSVKLVELVPKKGAKKFKSFSVPSACYSIRFLPKALVVATDIGGFQFIDVESAKTQDVLDFSDTYFKQTIPTEKPGARVLLQVGDTYLACFKEVGILISKSGRMAVENYKIEWLGTPQSFALLGEYVVAFSEDLIEIWHTGTRELVQSMPCSGIKYLSESQGNNHDQQILYCAKGGPLNQLIVYELQLLEESERKYNKPVVITRIRKESVTKDHIDTKTAEDKKGEESD